MGTTFSLKYAMSTAENEEGERVENVDTENAVGFMVIQIFTSLLVLLMMHCSNMQLQTIHGVILIAMYAVFVLLFVA